MITNKKNIKANISHLKRPYLSINGFRLQYTTDKCKIYRDQTLQSPERKIYIRVGFRELTKKWRTTFNIFYDECLYVADISLIFIIMNCQ